ncbi:TonB-dependent receptor [Algoriphagus sp. D3-2-R+10]|uniref:TonB-dependent receptor n=1 Tax=Algoriphagus aurantiacus TaxID=3103948 RepID=UPI002B366020|nr:TonB-dependent receptor [Algoriphagus sp. D3-2-R+10]MEB2778669.1 TonB-dependent receptor [Algoriphagus sp. D3-2-R+10]
MLFEFQHTHKIRIYFWMAFGIVLTFGHLNAQAQTEITTIKFQNDPGEKKARYVLTGKVTDKETGEFLSGAAVHVDGLFTGINTDRNGIYMAHLDSGRHRIVFRQFGKKAQFFIVELYGDGILDTELDDISFELETFIVREEEKDRNIKNPITGIIKMNIEDIKLIPTLMGEPDVFNVLQATPGVTSVGEGSSGLNVRGGHADQNLILMNEAVVLSNSHALGFLSSFNGDVVSNFTLYKGTVPSNFGGRSASALNIGMRKGDFEKWNFSGSLGTAVSKFLIEGPILPEKTSMIAALRRSNANWLLQKVNEPDVRNSNIKFHDIYLGLNHKFSQKHSLDFSLLNTGDYFRFSNQFGFEWNNFVTSLTSNNLLSENFSLIGMAAYGSFNNGFFELSNADPSIIKNGLDYYQGKITGLLTLENTSITFGGEAIKYQMSPETLMPFTAESGIFQEKVEKQSGLEFAPFVSIDWNPTESFSISGGLRYSQYLQLGPDSVHRYQEGLRRTRLTISGIDAYEEGTIVQYGGFEPRASLRWTFNEVNSIKAGYSSMFQYLQTISNATGPTPIDLWQLSTTYIQPQRSHNLSLGYFRNFNENEWSTSLEGFYRTTENQLEYRDFADLFLNPHLETEVIQGKGLAYGAEFLIQRNSGGITGWLAYTYSRSLIRTTSEFSEIQVNRGNWYPTNFDRPHIVSLVTNFHLGKGRNFNLNFNFSSGRPVTAPSTNYLVNGFLIPDYSDRNQFRIPNYFRMDLSYLAKGFVKNWNDKINFSVYNLLGRRNAYSVFFKREENFPRLRPYQVSILGSAFPSITYSVTFNK